MPQRQSHRQQKLISIFVEIHENQHYLYQTIINSGIMNRLEAVMSKGYSGRISNSKYIPHLKDDHYCIRPLELDGDAPKHFVYAYFYTQDGTVRRSNPRTWERFIVKSAEKWYPHETVIEYLLNRIGQVLGLRMNEVKLLIINNQIRFLSKYFLRPNEILIHGAELCGAHLADLQFAEVIAKDKNSARELFTFEFVHEAIEGVFGPESESILIDLVKMITFDAIVGNNDRHFYNWGVIRTSSRPGPSPGFSPIYDSARGLYWNSPDKEIPNIWSHRDTKGMRYIHSASPRISLESNTACNHFELLEYLVSTNETYRSTIQGLTNEISEQYVLDMYNSEFSRFFIPERNSLVKWTLQMRFSIIRKLL